MENHKSKSYNYRLCLNNVDSTFINALDYDFLGYNFDNQLIVVWRLNGK